MDDFIEASLRVGLMYRTDPFAILERSPRLVFEILNRSNDLIESMQRDRDD